MSRKECIIALGVLMGFLWLIFDGRSKATISTAKSRDTNTAFNLRNAISAYYTEYRSFPVSDELKTGVVELKSDNELMKFLMPEESNGGYVGNPKGIVFFSGRQARQRSANLWTNGVRISNDGTELFDFLGNHFRIQIDLMMSGKMVPPGGGVPVSDHVCIWSAGKDGDFSSWRDNVKTW